VSDWEERTYLDDLAEEHREARRRGELDVEPPDPSEYRDLERGDR
jgi:hypothetical protein